MSGSSRLSICLGVLLVLAFFSLPLKTANAQVDENLLQAHIQAGEFAPAINIAMGLADANRRDQWLGQIAAAQAQAGSRDAALRSTAEIYDDQIRAQSLSNMAAVPLGGRGGASEADFEPLLELIRSTVSPNSWVDVGGTGAVEGFHGGVFVDGVGVLRPAMKQATGGTLAALHRAAGTIGQNINARRSSNLRMVSLPRLEKHVQLLQAAGRPLTEAMQTLAGLQRIKYVFVYPETGDLVVAGPAGDWTADGEGRIVSAETGLPVVRLEDLAVVLRCTSSGADARFGCNIKPRPAALAKAQVFLKDSAKKPLKPGPAARNDWLKRVRDEVGLQDIEVGGIDPRTRAASVIVEADYRMKLVGMGLEDGVDGVDSYLESMKLAPGEAPPAMAVLRWWFTMNYDAVEASKDFAAFEIKGQGVKVLSENELLTAQGKRVHTGKSDPWTRGFAQSFTKHFDAMCSKYPVYAELRNIFDLALVCALIREEDLAGKIDWHMTCLGPGGSYPLELGPAAKEVETVINHRMIGRGQIVAGVSGGVDIYPRPMVDREAIVVDSRGYLKDQRSSSKPERSIRDESHVWWWD